MNWTSFLDLRSVSLRCNKRHKFDHIFFCLEWQIFPKYSLKQTKIRDHWHIQFDSTCLHYILTVSTVWLGCWTNRLLMISVNVFKTKWPLFKCCFNRERWRWTRLWYHTMVYFHIQHHRDHSLHIYIPNKHCRGLRWTRKFYMGWTSADDRKARVFLLTSK